MKKILATTIILIFVAGCSGILTSNSNTNNFLGKTPITQKHKLKPFNSIVLTGNTIVELVNGTYAMHVTGTKETLPDYQYKIKDKILYVEPRTTNLFQITIVAPKLKNITVIDNATLTAKNFKTGRLTIAAKNNGTINLEGWYAVDKIYQFGSGRINIRWLDSSQLFIESNSSGPIHLAGITKNIIAKLSGDTQLDARYLRAEKVSIFTTDNARADVLAVDTLDAFAVDKSNIYYYKRPLHYNVITKDSGNVLHPNWIH